MNKLHYIQNSAAHISPVFQNLHWLHIPQQIQHEILLTHTVLHNRAPPTSPTCSTTTLHPVGCQSIHPTSHQTDVWWPSLIPLGDCTDLSIFKSKPTCSEVLWFNSIQFSLFVEPNFTNYKCVSECFTICTICIVCSVFSLLLFNWNFSLIYWKLLVCFNYLM